MSQKRFSKYLIRYTKKLKKIEILLQEWPFCPKVLCGCTGILSLLFIYAKHYKMFCITAHKLLRCCFFWSLLQLLNQPRKLETVPMLFKHLIAKPGHAIIYPTLSFYRVFLLVRVGVIFCWESYIWPVFRIHDILVWIRIRIRGSMPLTNGSGCCYFRHSSFVIDFHDTNKKTNFIFKFFCLLLLKVHLHHFSKIKSSKEATKHQESRFFLLVLLADRRIRIRIHTSD